MIALLSAWLLGYALGRVWRPARKQKPARFASVVVGKYRPVDVIEYAQQNPAQVRKRFTSITAQDSTK